jgi:hypothetical protein
MKIIASIILFFFIAFLLTPTIVCVIEKSTDTSVFYSFSEEEQMQKDMKVIFHFDVVYEAINISELDASLIHSEHLLKHDKIASKIVIPPPKRV